MGKQQESGIELDERPPLLKARAPVMSTEARVYYRGPRAARMVEHAGPPASCAAAARGLIEPYALRRTRAGHLLLFAGKQDTGETRAYRVDRIESVRVCSREFRPVYRVEL